jgi:hypothetical protein
VLGVSVDSADSHKQFCTKGGELQTVGRHRPQSVKCLWLADESRTG